jgi:hypothetical protein
MQITKRLKNLKLDKKSKRKLMLDFLGFTKEEYDETKADIGTNIEKNNITINHLKSLASEYALKNRYQSLLVKT